MSKITGFLEQGRVPEHYAPAGERVAYSKEFIRPLTAQEAQLQAVRCMDCGIPFCNSGCPVHNIIPDFNNLVYQDDWREALENLHSTNNFPEFTGRACPAPCESACVLNIADDPVGIKSIELAIIERGWQEGWVRPEPPEQQTGRTVAVVGSGPAGLAAAQQLARAGHSVTVFEKNDRIGGLLRYGIPDFKMEKHHIDRRISQMEAEGVVFRPGVVVGEREASERYRSGGVVDLSSDVVTSAELQEQFDAVLLAGGAENPREMEIPGRDLSGIHHAMEFLTAHNRSVAGDAVAGAPSAQGKQVVVIGGGDTGSDCIGTSHRQGAAGVTQFIRRPELPGQDPLLTWPDMPMTVAFSSSHEEGGERAFATVPKEFVGEGGRVTGVRTVQADLQQGQLVEVPGTERMYPADLVLLAIGFDRPVTHLLEAFGVAQDLRGNAQAGDDEVSGYLTSTPGVFAAGDIRRGASLIVWAIREGRQAARAIDQFLMGESRLPR
ncbi:glutamate synthase subunit beta [Deinococcus sp. Marseille-Q6407]|uniref:glutamate synthase subunit beta n=1 Tax=Deinococcus sp. Marseille-Q6407 TaxID=2969223 RepID=UPI0021BDFC41|nr:glutamate synthase subunit beta [Deinococcus sp. Marseille-Q6407]